MNRFYTTAATAPRDEGFAIVLDERGIKTPRGAPLIVPTEPFAEAVADEWRSQVEEIDPRSMPLTGLANAAIDLFASDRATHVQQLGAYAETDALVYRGDDRGLVERQAAEWNPLLDWAEGRWAIQFTLATGVIHIAQPLETVQRLKDQVAQLDAWMLAALSPLTTLGGSLVVALGVVEGAIDPATGWAAVTLEERFEEERWGVDADAVAARQEREAEWLAAARFGSLLRG
jgi:chaperone required for assembly of F1-ATPase